MSVEVESARKYKRSGEKWILVGKWPDRVDVHPATIHLKGSPET